MPNCGEEGAQVLHRPVGHVPGAASQERAPARVIAKAPLAAPSGKGQREALQQANPCAFKISCPPAHPHVEAKLPLEVVHECPVHHATQVVPHLHGALDLESGQQSAANESQKAAKRASMGG